MPRNRPVNPIFESRVLKPMKGTSFLHEISGNFSKNQFQLLLIDPYQRPLFLISGSFTVHGRVSECQEGIQKTHLPQLLIVTVGVTLAWSLLTVEKLQR